MEQFGGHTSCGLKVLYAMFHEEQFWGFSRLTACQVNLLEVVCFVRDNLHVIKAICALVLADFYSVQKCYFLSMQISHPEISAREQRQIRDVAFAKMLEDMKPENQLKNELIQARKRAGLTQRELAIRMGTDQSSVARLENGRSSPTVKTLRKLAAVTHCRLILRLEGLSEMGR